MEAIDLKRTKYQVLDIAESIGCEEIAGLRRDLSKRFHPSGGEHPDELLMKEINDACDTLGDPQRRAVYDQRLAQARNEQRAVEEARRREGQARRRRQARAAGADAAAAFADALRKPASSTGTGGGSISPGVGLGGVGQRPVDQRRVVGGVAVALALAVGSVVWLIKTPWPATDPAASSVRALRSWPGAAPATPADRHAVAKVAERWALADTAAKSCPLLTPQVKAVKFGGMAACLRFRAGLAIHSA